MKASLPVFLASRPATKVPATIIAAYHNEPARNAVAGDAPSADIAAVRLYCVSRAISESACAGRTLAKYSTFPARPRNASDNAARAPPIRANGTRAAGTQTASATQAGSPKCGSTSALAAKAPAARYLPRHAQYAAIQMKASASGTTSPKGSESTPSERASTAKAMSQAAHANRTSA
jgi:hypothetical protein